MVVPAFYLQKFAHFVKVVSCSLLSIEGAIWLISLTLEYQVLELSTSLYHVELDLINLYNAETNSENHVKKC